MSKLSVAEHVRAPGFRLIADGPSSGEWFRNDVLAPALRDAIRGHEKLTVVLDGVAGYGTSFLEEAFGGLVRKGIASKVDLDRYLEISAGPLFAPYRQLALRYIYDATPELVHVENA